MKTMLIIIVTTIKVIFSINCLLNGINSAEKETTRVENTINIDE
jgi:hypothetical protein